MSRQFTLTPAQEMRVLVGFVVQPFVAALIAFAIAPVVEYTGRPFYGGQAGDPFGLAVSLAAGAGLVTVFVIPLAALPAFAGLVKRGPLTLGRVLVSGALLGNVPGAAILGLVAVQAFVRGDTFDLARLTYGWLGLIRSVALGAFVGTASAFVFWLMVRRHLSDEPAASAPAL